MHNFAEQGAEQGAGGVDASQVAVAVWSGVAVSCAVYTVHPEGNSACACWTLLGQHVFERVYNCRASRQQCCALWPERHCKSCFEASIVASCKAMHEPYSHCTTAPVTQGDGGEKYHQWQQMPDGSMTIDNFTPVQPARFQHPATAGACTCSLMHPVHCNQDDSNSTPSLSANYVPFVAPPCASDDPGSRNMYGQAERREGIFFKCGQQYGQPACNVARPPHRRCSGKVHRPCPLSRTHRGRSWAAPQHTAASGWCTSGVLLRSVK